MSIKNIQVETAKLSVGNRDWSKPGIPDVLGNGELTCPGISIFGDSIAGGFKAAVNIGPPLANLGKTLPNSLWVEGNSVFIGMVENFGLTFHFGMTTLYGVTVKNALSLKNGVDIKNAIGLANGPVQDNTTHTIGGSLTVGGVIAAGATVTAPKFFGDVTGCTGTPTGCKPFDIPHWKTKGKRIRHVCTEGPEAGIYIRGRLTGKNVIELPEYWDGLVDYDSITVNLTQIKTSQDLIVDSVEKDHIKIISGNATKIDCFYHVWVSRWINQDDHDEKLHVVYDGMSPDDYPGDNSGFVIGGWDYDRRQTQWPHHLEENE